MELFSKKEQEVPRNLLKIDLYFSQKQVDSALDLKAKNVVMVDVLRTSTTMAVSLFNGAKEIIPTEDVATAGLIGRNSKGHSLLCGERNGKIIEGFNLGNSIKEYSKEVVNGKTLIFNSTNGTPALMKAKFAKNCVVLGFANITRVADYLIQLNEDFIILCAGRMGEFSLEDTVCSGMLISILTKTAKSRYEWTDSALGAKKLYSAYKINILSMLMDSEHGKFLVGIGFEDDLVECSKIDSASSLPLLRNGVIRTIESFESDPKLMMKKVIQKSINS